MKYTVHELSELAGTSIRTLHYYDEIGLLNPSFTGENGYRYYEEKELLRLQQILFFRELDFSLEDIKHLLNRADFQLIESLKEQRKLLRLKQTRLDKLILTINKTIKRMSNNQNIKDEELYDAFKDDDVKQYQEEVKERWGNTEAYKQSMAKVSKMTVAEMNKYKADLKKFNEDLAALMDKGVEDPAVQKMIEKHYEGIKFFYDCPIEMYRNMGKMYVADPRFAKNYDDVRPGMAIFMRDAINYFCDHRS